FGNGTAIFTNDGGAARRFQKDIRVGMVGINVPIPVPVATFSFGGWKDSMFGDTEAHWRATGGNPWSTAPCPAGRTP
ncbi:aldehyde dehydrogenase family protein, partial [Mycobacterium kansasii]